MTITTTKLNSVAGLAPIAARSTMKTIERTTRIAASPERVWRVLTDTAAYAEWNPFITRIDGEFVHGTRLIITINPGRRSMTFRPTVIDVRPGELLRWRGRMGIPGIFDGDHEFNLVQTPDGGTLFTQRETFTGVLVPLLRTVLADTANGFVAMNGAIAARAIASEGVTGGNR